MNWRKLKDFCNNLPESELQKEVNIWREEASDIIREIECEQLEEDYYVNDECPEDGCMPLSIAESIIKDDSNDYPDGIKHFSKAYDKGHPILNEVL